MSDDVLVRVENVSKRFCRSLKRSLWYGLQDLGSELGGRRHGGGCGLPRSSADVELRKDEFWAVKDVSFELRRGECLGLIGRNGAGKTTLLRMLNGLIKPDTGQIEMRGSVGALIALGAGFNPILTGRENIYTSASVLGLNKKDIDSKIDQIIDFAEINKFIDSPVQSYSSGMQVRLGFAVAVSLAPDIMLLDEVLAVGDIGFRNKCYKALASMREQGTSFILVTHDMSAVTRVCGKAIYMKSGQVKEKGQAFAVIQEYESDSARKELHNDYLSISREKTTNISLVELRTSGKTAKSWQSLAPGEIIFTLSSHCHDYSLNKLTITYAFSGHSIMGNSVYAVNSCELKANIGTSMQNKELTFSLLTDQVNLPPGNYFLKIGVWQESFKQIAAAESLQVRVEPGNISIADSTHIQTLKASIKP